jgi:hypothetical protein
LMIVCRFVAPDSPLFYVGMCAGFFLPLALYGPANLAITHTRPARVHTPAECQSDGAYRAT